MDISQYGLSEINANIVATMCGVKSVADIPKQVLEAHKDAKTVLDRVSGSAFTRNELAIIVSAAMPNAEVKKPQAASPKKAE